MSRLPVTLRLTLVFALAMTIVLAALGTLLYVRLGNSLEEQLDESLLLRASSLSAVVEERGGELSAGGDEGFAQLLGPDGALVAASPVVAGTPLISPAQAAQARDGDLFVTREKEVPLDDPARLLATPVDAGILVVGAALDEQHEALNGLLAQLLIVGPLAVLLASLAGFALARSALRPVEAMRRHAAEVSTEISGRRLPLPAARDEIRRLGETLNAMLARLESSLARERRFVADASHELRTPLALLRTELELALRQPRQPDELVAALRSAAEEVERLTRLAEDLLVLARVSEEGLALRRAALSADDLLETVAGRFAARAESEGRPLTVDGSARLPGDRLRLEQALSNLVDNAFRHGAGGIRLEARDGDGSVELSVSDEGPGFPPEFLPQAFDRFTRADEARGGGSAGLGLALVDAVARAHGGSARARNRSGGGATVAIVLPSGEDG